MNRHRASLVVCAMLALALSVTGCTQIVQELPNAARESQKSPLVTPEEYKQIKIGMSEADVTTIVGAPPTESRASLDVKDEVELNWTNYDGSILFITLKDGRVSEIKDYDLVNKVK